MAARELTLSREVIGKKGPEVRVKLRRACRIAVPL